jgi:hypothetical protein
VIIPHRREHEKRSLRRVVIVRHTIVILFAQSDHLIFVGISPIWGIAETIAVVGSIYLIDG